MNIVATLRQRRLKREESRKDRAEQRRVRDEIVYLKIDLVRMQMVHRKAKLMQQFAERWNVEIDAWRPNTPGWMVYQERKLQEGVHARVIAADMERFYQEQLHAEAEYGCIDLYADLCRLHRLVHTRDEANDLRTHYELELDPSIKLHEEFARLTAHAALAA